MSTGDGRNKIGSAAERALHAEFCAAVWLTVDTWCAARQTEHEQASGYQLKKSVLKEGLAEHLGVSLRQLDAYCHGTPISLAKAALLARFCGDERLPQLFAEQLGAVAVPLPTLSGPLDLKRALHELHANQKEFTDFQDAAPRLADEGGHTPAFHAAILKEGTEEIVQSLRVIMISELLAHGEVKLPLLLWAQRRNGNGGAPPPYVDRNLPRPAWEPEHGFEADEPADWLDPELERQP